jgi:hypothetical protein
MGVAAWRTFSAVFRPNTETPRSFRFAGDVVVGRGCTGDDTPRAFRGVCGSARPTVSPGGRMGRGERREHTHWRRGTHNSSWTDRAQADATERTLGAMAKAHEGGAVLSPFLCWWFTLVVA